MSLKKKSLANLTADVSLESIVPSKGKVLISIKSWPAQSAEGIFISESYAVIRNNKYVAEVLQAGEGVRIVKKGDVITLSAFAGHHVATTHGHAKIINNTDILTIKKQADMTKGDAFKPETFSPGINYALVRIKNIKEQETESGIIVSTQTELSKNDAITKTAEVLSVGSRNDYGKGFTKPEVGSRVIIDNFVGDRLNDTVTDPEFEYRVIYIFDVLGYIK